MREKKGFLSGLFGSGKSDGGCCNMEIVEENSVEKQTSSCGCSENEESHTVGKCCGKKINDICCIKVLGAGCKSCQEQYEYAKKAVAEIGLSVEVEYITDMEKVMAYGVMSMPAIVVNEKVASMGKVLKTSDVVKLLKNMGI